FNLFTFEFVRLLTMPDGLVESHLRWGRDALAVVQRNLRWATPLVVAMAFVAGGLSAQPNEVWHESLGRLAYIVAVLAWAVLLERLLRPSGALVEGYGKRHRQSWVYRLRYVWYVLAVGLHVALAVVAALGYYYTALELSRSVRITLWFLLLVALVNAALVDWLLLVWRKLITRDPRRLAEAGPPSASPEGEQAERASAEDLYAPGLQSRRLVRGLTVFALLLGLWFIWSDVLPALGILRRVVLWETTGKVTEVVAGPEGAETRQLVEQSVPVTLADVVLGVLIAATTVMASRNLPGLLQITVLHRLPFDQGLRFAITAIVRYVIIVVGVVLALGIIGLGWSKVQWLVAALGVGLGFGLQEIVANFVSGLIILFEQPMRVGDTVTVGETTGTVTEIRIRATTITDWDRKELLVPNKEFITGRLLNWTRSDEVVRIIFPVGIAYGSDTALAERTLLRVADECPLILDEPGPSVLFHGFGTSALQFQLRAFIPEMKRYYDAWHQVHMAIDRAFREAGIEIAFPQQDIHLRSARAPLRIERDGEPPGPQE
ncbi:MAG: mechanosensitive ion channel domain-containing protein, partial [Planctomycetota bacterium]